MYRQIRIDSKDANYQKILYRFTTDDPISVYQLETLTYGTRPASFIATRCLKDLAEEAEASNPRLAKIIAQDFYMDDLITGGDDENELINIRDQLISKLGGAGFHLRKWVSNNKAILENLESQEIHLVIDCKDSDSLKTLGICWAPISDIIEYNSILENEIQRITKRTILGDIAKICDPLGLLGPVTVVAKIIMQELWILKLSWDESVPSNIFTRWKTFTDELKKIKNWAIPRRVMSNENSQLELHGFADASESAYGACVYLREQSATELNSTLICAKSRIAPLQVLSIPRLELCAALLLAEWMSKVLVVIQGTLNRNIVHTNYYSDSTIALSWIHSCPSKWKCFIATRVAKIHEKSNKESWFHVKTHENPADVISRGSLPDPLGSNKIWWKEPEFLRNGACTPKPFKPNDNEGIPEIKVLLLQNEEFTPSEEFATTILNKFSSLPKLIMIIALCKRFISNCKGKPMQQSADLVVTELRDAENCLIKVVQKLHFKFEINDLTNQREVNKKSKILSLNPFLDANRILRVGGRLRNAELDYEANHPILLPRGTFSDLIIRTAHEKNMHTGLQGTLANVRLRYWPLAGKSTVKKTIRSCVICFKHNPRKTLPKMGDLTPARLRVSRTYSKVGLDFFGPFHLEEGSRRAQKITKAYGCVFVCMPTKAVHCELVENLTSEAFIAALKRFISRRGLPADIYCDNARRR